jgi:hypothetical protein
VDCLVGGMNGNVHYFRRTGELDTPTYTHRVSNIFPFAFNQTSTGFGSLRSSRNTLKALGLGSAFAMSALTSASTAIAVSAAGGILLQATGADAVNVYLNPYNRRTAAVPFYGYFNSSETHMKCVCGSAEGNVELFSQVSAASKNKTIGEVGRADSQRLVAWTWTVTGTWTSLSAAETGRRECFCTVLVQATMKR